MHELPDGLERKIDAALAPDTGYVTLAIRVLNERVAPSKSPAHSRRGKGRATCRVGTMTRRDWWWLGSAVITAIVLLSISSVDAQVAFSRVTTSPNLGRLDYVLAVADLNGDGRDDILAGGREEYTFYGAPEDRFTKTLLHVFVGNGDGTLRHASELVEGTIEARHPVVVADDFNGDGRPDLAVFDAGVYVGEEHLGYGNPPQLFLSGQDGVLRPSTALADAVRIEHEHDPPVKISSPSDLHLKTATSGDIDNDGDIDLWVESTGGANFGGHFMVNNGDGTFTADPDLAIYQLRHNPSPEFWRHNSGHLVDRDNDGDLDLVLGQMRGTASDTTNQFSIVLLNDGTGYYPSRIELPHPAFNQGFTVVHALTHFDVNGDGFQDLLLMHQRNDDALPDVIPFTGRYIQVLINRDGASFGDETPTWMGDQSATTPERNANGDELSNVGEPKMHDVDRDGCADLVMSRTLDEVRTESPLVYRNNGSGQFQAIPPEPFAGSDRYFGLYAVPADVNGDGMIDFVVPQRYDGPDDQPRTADDFGTLVTLLNTTPAGSIRCSPRVTAIGTLPALRTLP